MNRTHRKRQAFSLMELLAVVTILGVIAAIIVPRVSTSSATARERVHSHNIATINSAVERYYIETGSFPATDLSDIGGDPDYFPDGIPNDPRGAGTNVYQLDGNQRAVSVAAS